MEKEYEQWIKKADKDLNTAKSNINNGEIEAGAFFLQQSAEKALKSLLIKRTKALMKTHDLVILSKKVNAPEKITKYCERLTTLYQETRYPDVKSEEDIKEEINTLLLYAEEVLKWTKENL
ncbi:HEPN domain-containing protein [Candidatus Pacearchaeota archaeon]|nr:HEPN domain-containing protein [Candidatus Pacearchaeota archaeon]